MSKNLDSAIVYGWNEGNRDFVLDYEWLANYSTNTQIFASDIIRDEPGEAIYGIQCDFDTDGSISLTNGLKEEVEFLFDLIMKVLPNKQKECVIGYHKAIAGDMNWEEHIRYVPFEGKKDIEYEYSDSEVNYDDEDI